MDIIPVLTELERQEEVSLSLKVIQKQDWYKLDVFLYKDLIMALAQVKKMDEVMQLWESMRKEDLFPDSQTHTEVIRRFLRYGSPADTMNIYEDMKNSPDPPEELPSHILII
ncbi:Pentatricopeptide repeat-containing protein family [Quillaja saponaria]|uniref:Pentatricopeptide repeat-containing protein family n=1 Tax=Quillaja saponaria TaxID=32244 RepID=A0AAD7VM16_QUISA|nr:Pentatricopeptide repeat-containing protein family [Quillaja saponaria]